jgi:hypothetical protein
MSRTALHLLFVATSAVALFACGSDTTTTGTTGTGGSASTSTTSASGTGGSASTSTTTGTSTASSSGTGAGVMNACTNMADAAVIAAKDVKAITTMCGQMNVGAEPATKNCIIMGTGLTDDCAGCYSGEVDCVSEHCIGAEGKCLTAPADQLCTDCRNMYCVPAYEACSGNKSM